ncbi:MAG: hypothetical protein KDK76_01300 [Chlamydiia bacterium]|nr:hypothetical protein [Chlamydiia bacterium]
MSFDVQFHDALKRVNWVVEEPTKWCDVQAKEHPQLYKGVLVVNHLFRAVSLWAFLKYGKQSMTMKLTTCFLGSLGYRLTVESNCSYKFALPAFGGAVALLLAQRSYFGLIPLTAYFTYITLTTSYDVDHPCCRRGG